MFMDLMLTVPADLELLLLADHHELIRRLIDEGQIGTHFDVAD